MKLPAALLSAVFSVSCLAADSLDIGSGETYVVSSSQQRMTLDSLTIGDGAKITFAEGVSQWQLRADRVRIGTDVVIDASGRAGAAGAPGRGFSGRAVDCRDGRDGLHGGNGSAGGNGVSVRLQLGLVELGGLRVISDGGAGGAGGIGGDGQDAGEFGPTCKDAPAGGAAGNGGSGANGGNGGDVMVTFWSAGSSLNAAAVPDRIQALARPGSAGAAGRSGNPGSGSEGHYMQKRTLSGSRAWVGGGDPGAQGRPGSPGQQGLAGRTLVEQALVTTQPVVKPRPAPAPGSAKTTEEEIREIRQSLKALTERLDRLEKRQK